MTHRMLRVLPTALAAAPALAFASSARAEASSSDSSSGPSFTERTVGSYENRLRKFSSPERVFEYFSSVEIDRHFFMTRDDLARAITPYTFRSGAPLASKNAKFNPKALATKPASEAVDKYVAQLKELLLETVDVTPADVSALLAFRDEHQIDFETHVKALRNLQITNSEFEQFVEIHGGPAREKSFFDLVDADGDGLISYAEYMFFNTLLAIPERQFELAFKMFDSDGNGRLDHREFKHIIDLMRLRTPAGRQDRSLKEEDAPVFKHLFGELATETLSYDDFLAFRRALQQEILRIQISSSASFICSCYTTDYDLDGNNELSPREFGMFLVSHVNQNQIGKWVERVEELHDMKGTISEQDFINFSVLLEHLDELKVAITISMEDHGLNKEQFQRATKAALRGRKSEQLVTPLQIDILFALFDLDGDGHLSPKEFIHVMEKRKDAGFNECRDTGVFELLGRVKACMESSA
ncbi:hypothetical protein PybrP1_007618 [[Pythium] brassicae (nom. inval.)]|nr:hypothetical protein PybrP1_007618 [[Pythium] brassicae (nom. inval.)]